MLEHGGLVTRAQDHGVFLREMISFIAQKSASVKEAREEGLSGLSEVVAPAHIRHLIYMPRWNEQPNGS